MAYNLLPEEYKAQPVQPLGYNAGLEALTMESAKSVQPTGDSTASDLKDLSSLGSLLGIGSGSSSTGAATFGVDSAADVPEDADLLLALA